MALQPSCQTTQPPVSPARSRCQRKKCKCICFTLALRAFSAVVLRDQMQCVWHRERISITNMLTGQKPTVPSPLSAPQWFPFKVCPYSNYTLVALKTQMIMALVISNQKLSIFVVSPSLYSSYSGYGPSKALRIFFTITSAHRWLIKRRITSISLWRIEYFMYCYRSGVEFWRESLSLLELESFREHKCLLNSIESTGTKGPDIPYSLAV